MALFGLSKKTDYGLIMLTILARRGVGEVVCTSEMVEEKNLPRAFVSQIAKDFVEAGILGSREGKGGGYFLKKDPGKITVKEIMESIEGRVAPAACVIGKKGCVCDGKCDQKDFMVKLAGDMGGVLDSYSLAEVAGLHNAS